jgi:protein tyrosine/serine phosphatase
MLRRSLTIMAFGAAALFISLSGGCRNSSMASKDSLSADTAARFDQWAAPIDLPGVPNSRKVSDGLYRGAQPDEEGFESLRALGVRTVINLRGNDSNRDRYAPGQFDSIRIPMDGFDPRDEQVVEFLRVAGAPDAQPVFVHCQHGADRTGVLIAMHRVVIDGWTREQAIAEMTRGGTRFHALYGNLIKFVRDADVEAIRAAMRQAHVSARD